MSTPQNLNVCLKSQHTHTCTPSTQEVRTHAVKTNRSKGWLIHNLSQMIQRAVNAIVYSKEEWVTLIQEFVHSLFQSVSRYLMSVYYMPGSGLSEEKKIVTNTSLANHFNPISQVRTSRPRTLK